MKSCWRALGVVVVGTTLAACIKIAPFEKKDGGADDATDASSDAALPAEGAIAVPNGQGVDVTNGSLYSVAFGGESFHFPYAMTVGATSVMGGGDGVGCAEEFNTGIALFPAGRVIGTMAQGVLQDTITIEFAGPPVAKVALDWAQQYPCGGTPQSVSGRSTFTFFPDGHINRSDQVHSTATLDGAMCSCGGGSNWYVTSFFTANHAVVDNVFNAILPTDSVSSVMTTSPTVCFNGFANNFQFAMGWRLPVSTRLRTPVAGSSGTIAFVRDLTPPGATNMIAPFDLEGQTTWWVATDSDCTALSSKVFPYTDPNGSLPELNIQPGTGVVVSQGVALDGIFGGENGAGSMGYQSAAPDVHLTVDTNIGAFAFWLALGSGEDIQSVTKTPGPTTNPWYFQQTRNGSNHRLFWFPDGLKTGEEIIIRIQ